MYWCFIILPLSGLLIALLFSLGMKDGWMQDFAIGLHEFSASLSYILIGVHITGAIYSRIKEKEFGHLWYQFGTRNDQHPIS